MGALKRMPTWGKCFALLLRPLPWWRSNNRIPTSIVLDEALTIEIETAGCCRTPAAPLKHRLYESTMYLSFQR